ncbi:hypothetical protein [Thiomicrorhabdus arctica]|jgi:hypothetical protein|uniref:hypothetical protein n=1 Tax=Thiomicrorhabdus arctica TaxID=131540 RepID=UPI000366F96E|nr:hypothetical protein [Thiomicrorhabdus arctica]
MKQLLRTTLLTALLVQSPLSSADDSAIQLLNYLNTNLKHYLLDKDSVIDDIQRLSTFQRNNQIIVQVTHNPKSSYSHLVEEIAQRGGRVNGINFQNVFTLYVLDNYCQEQAFSTIISSGLNETVLIQYQDLNGRFIVTHTINNKMC